jgi:hypothetical protein
MKLSGILSGAAVLFPIAVVAQAQGVGGPIAPGHQRNKRAREVS